MIERLRITALSGDWNPDAPVPLLDSAITVFVSA